MSNITKNLNIYKDVTNLIGMRSFGKEDLVVPYRQLNGTKVGSPRINSGFIASGFSGSDYIRTNYIFNPSSYDWEWCCKFRQTENYTSYVQYIFSGAKYQYAPYFTILKNGLINVSIGNGYEAPIGWTTDFVAEINKWYWAKLSYTSGVGYKLEISEDGVNWVQIEETYTSFITFNPTYEIYLAHCEHDTYLRGEIDLKETYIKVNGVDVWRGDKTTDIISRNDMQNYVLSGIDVQPVMGDNKAVIDFSNVKLPWKFEHKDKLQTSRFAIAPLGTTVTQPKYVKELNGTIVGSPTITEDFIVSGFNSSSWLNIPYEFPTSYNRLEFFSKFNTGSLGSSAYPILCQTGANKDIFINGANRKIAIYDGVNDYTGTTTLQNNTNYMLKATVENGVTKVYIDGTLELSVSTNIFNVSKFSLGVCPVLTSLMFSGSIDLKETYLKVNDTEVWRGAQWVATEEMETLQGCIRYYYGEGEHVTIPPRDSTQYYNVYAVNGDEGIVLDSKWFHEGTMIYDRPIITGGEIPQFENEWYLGEYRVETGEEGYIYIPIDKPDTAV